MSKPMSVKPEDYLNADRESYGWFPAIFSLLVFAGLYALSVYNYLLFHSIAEVFSVVIAFCIFVIAWNSQGLSSNNYLLVVGIGYLFVGGIDLVHTIAYKGMGVFLTETANLPTQLWIAARYLESVTLLVAPRFLGRRFSSHRVFAGFLIVFAALLGSIFFHIFPVCYVEGMGLTPFKKISEYAISLILVFALVSLFTHRKDFDRRVLRLVVFSIIFTIFSEIAFTFYVGVYDLSNLAGHLFKILSFYLIYRAIIKTGFVEPYHLIFRDLKHSQESLQKAHGELEARVEERTAEIRKQALVLHEQASLLNQTHETILVRSLEDKISFWNRGAEEMYGWSAQEALGKITHTLLQARFPDSAEKTTREIVESGKWEGELVHVRRDGTEIIVDSRQALLFNPNGKPVGILEINSEITERKKAEQALQKALDELEKRVEERTAQLAAANQELEGFSYSVAHDLRAPLRAIDGFSRMFLEDYGNTVPPEAKRLLSVVRSNTLKMGQLIDDLLAFSRVGRQDFRVTRIDFQTLAGDIFRELRAESPGREIEFRPGKLDSAQGDPAMIRQVLQNLFSNALKFTRTKESAVIEMNSRPEGEEIIFSIKDNGVGFDTQYAAKLFGVFQRLHSENEFEGTGVGLAIVERIIRRHGGRVWAEATPGEGATFYFSLPENSAQDSSGPGKVEESRDSEGLRNG